MGLRLLGALVVVCALSSCKGDAKKLTDLDKRCQQLGSACGDTAKHTEKFVDECKQAATQVETKCIAGAIALYDCYEKELCGKSDQVWSLADLAVLAKRHDKCTAELEAADKCPGK